MRLTLAALTLAGIAAAQSSTAATLYSQDFETNSAGFTGGAAVGSQSLGSVFGTQVYRSQAPFPSTTATLNLNLGQAATATNLSLSLAIIDSWDNGSGCCGPDRFSITVDGNEVFGAVFANYQVPGPTTATGLSSLQYGSNLAVNADFQDATYSLSLNLGNLSAGSHNISFSASGPGWQGGDDESFGLDNVRITGITAAVPEPSSWAMLIAGVACMGLVARRRLGAVRRFPA